MLCVLPPTALLFSAPAGDVFPEDDPAPADADAPASAVPETEDAAGVRFSEDVAEFRTTVLVVPPPTRSRPAANTLVAHPSMLNVSATTINIFVNLFLAPLITILPLSTVKPVLNPFYSLVVYDYITVFTAKKAFISRLFTFTVFPVTDSVQSGQIPLDLV